MKNFSLLLLSLLLGFQNINSQTDDGRASDSKLIEVSKGIYLYQNRGGNIGISIGPDGIFMIDDQYEEITEDLLKDLKKLSKDDVDFVINTHHHGDHTGGNANMVKEGATIISHSNVRKRLQDYLAENSSVKIDERILPTLTFHNDITFHYNREEIYVFHIEKAHTDGDVIVHFKGSNVVHTGDAFVNGQYPFIDSRNGGSVQGYIDGIETILSTIDKDTKVIPGHGNIANYQDVRAMGSLLTNAWKRVAYHFLKGKSEQEILRMTDITKEYDDKGFGDGYITRERFLKSIYDEVAVAYDQRDYYDRKDQIEKIKKDQDGGK